MLKNQILFSLNVQCEWNNVGAKYVFPNVNVLICK